MAEKRGQYSYNDDGTVSALVTIAGADSTGGAVNTTTNDVLPTEIQSRYATTIQTHTNAAVAPSSESNGSWIDLDGYDKISITCIAPGGFNTSTWLHWSHDGASIHGSEIATPTQTSGYHTPVTKEKVARYVRVVAKNEYTAPQTMGTWATLKA